MKVELRNTLLFFMLLAVGLLLFGFVRAQFFSPCSGPLLPMGAIDGARHTAIRLKMDPHPALYKAVPMEVAITPCFTPSGDTEAYVDLPPSAAFINGQTTWRGVLEKGQTARFSATVAFVAEGSAHLRARAIYSSQERTSTLQDIESFHAFVTAKGDGVWPPPEGTATPEPGATPGPKPYWRTPEIGYEPPEYVLEGNAPVNLEENPRAFLISYSHGLRALEAKGLLLDTAAGLFFEKPGASSGSEITGNRVLRGITLDDFATEGILFALYDGLRPTTGYTLAVARKEQDNSSPPNTLTLDIIATAPSTGWAVENRQVSPYTIYLIQHAQVPKTLVLRVNGTIVGEFAVVQGSESGIQELELPPLPIRAIP